MSEKRLAPAKGNQNFSINDTQLIEEPVEKKDPDASKKLEMDPEIKEVRDFNKKDLGLTHFCFGDQKLSYATESNIHYMNKKTERPKRVDSRAMLTNQFEFGDPAETKKGNFYKTTYNIEVSDKDQNSGIIGQPVTLLSQKNASQI